MLIRYYRTENIRFLLSNPFLAFFQYNKKELTPRSQPLIALSLSANLHQPSLSCGSKHYAGLKLQSQVPFASARPNLTAELFKRVHKSIHFRDRKPNAMRITMMPIVTPQVPYRTSGEGTWQWVDRWNALGSRMAMPLSRIALQAPAGAARGQADDIRNEAVELLRIRNHLYNELAKNTSQLVEKIYKDLSRMKRFNAGEALEYGLIDRIVRSPKIDAPPKDTGTGLG